MLQKVEQRFASFFGVSGGMLLTLWQGVREFSFGRNDRSRLLRQMLRVGYETVPLAMALLGADEQPQIVHQAGEKHIEALKANYAAVGVQAHCVAFIEDMAGAYEWADLVICRSGALTVAELAVAGVASILVPFPHAVDDHQTGNARFLVNVGGAFLLPQAELTPEAIALIRNYSRGQLLEMAEKARSLARPEAADELAEVCAEVAK